MADPAGEVHAEGGSGAARHPRRCRQAVPGNVRRGHDKEAQAREALECYWPAYARHGAADALARQVRSLRTRDTLDVADSLHRLDVPARIVWGTADQFQKVRYGERLARDLSAELHRIAGGKHWVPEDHPAAIADAVSDLLAKA